MSFGARLRVEGDRINEPNRDVTVLLYERGENRGELGVEVTYLASQGDKQFGTEEVARLPGGDNPYTERWVDLDLPPEDETHVRELPANRPFKMTPQYRSPRAFRLRMLHYPPANGTGLSAIDDVAVINWTAPEPRPDGGYRTPSPFDFLRIADVEAGEVITVSLESYGS